ncbi:hypothetical protein FQN57_003128 [Myotisia sp. PD_48]|nr:hypothetical protein FQN57_003128 [Myotisia sp. PD_48]
MDHFYARHEGHAAPSPSPTTAGSHSSHSSSSSSSGGMTMVFFSSTTTPLYSSSWTPKSSGSYAGTCIFLIFLAILGRAILALKYMLELRALAAARKRRYVVVAGQTPESERIATDSSGDNTSTDGEKSGTFISAHGVEERVRVVNSSAGPPVMPWRFSVDIPRAALVTVLAGIGYLLMLAVMTMNVGYFLSVLAGVFIGDLAIGRLSHRWDEH